MKKKTSVLVGIAVCALLMTLLISPVLANNGYSKIYDNANEDDTIDMRDVTYIKLFIFGKKPATDFSDANYDGTISMLDVGQTKLIILGREMELTLIDQVDSTVTIQMPIERVITPYPIATNIIFTLHGQDKLVGVDDWAPNDEWLQRMYPGIADITNVGKPWSVNIETVIGLDPDVVIGAFGDTRTQLEDVGIPVIGLNLGSGADLEGAILLLGKVIGEEDNAQEVTNYYEENMDMVIDRTSTIPTENKVKVLSIGRDNIYTAAIGGCYQDRMIKSAGGINVAEDVAGDGWFTQVSIEQIIGWNPEVILVPPYIWDGSVADILNDPQWQDIDAVKNGSVFYVPRGVATWDCPEPESFLCPLWIAKLLYPDRFADINIEEEVKTFYSRFYHLDITDEEVESILNPSP